MILHKTITHIKTIATLLALIAVFSLLINTFSFGQEARGQAISNINEFYVAPDGLSTNPGTIEKPWDIKSALLGHSGDVGPGDTIWMRGGTYQYPDRLTKNHGFVFDLQGSSEAPITVRAYTGEQATLDGGLHNTGAPRHVRIQDLEIIVSENFTEPRISQQSGSSPNDLNRPWGSVYITSGHDIKLINNTIHDNTGSGIGFWSSVSGNSEVYGNLIYNNGWTGPDRKHGHGLYAQNNSGDWKYIRDNIFLDAYSLNIQVYGSSRAYVNKFIIDRNIIGPGYSDGRLLVGGGNAPNEIRMKNNVLYDASMQIGYISRIGDDIVVTDNTITKGNLSFSAPHTNLTATGNMTWHSRWANPRIDGAKAPIPSEPLVFLNPNIYDSNRGNLAVMAFQGQTEAIVDFSTLLKVGDTFHLKDPTDFFGDSVYVGTYTGSPTSVPITGEFTAYVVLKNGQWGGPPLTKSNNNIPEAKDDDYTVDGADRTLAVSASGVLANDTDVDKGTLKVVLASGPSQGTLDLKEDGSFTYILSPEFANQQDSFTYRVTDGDISSTIATVTINVGNVPPSLSFTKTIYSALEDKGESTITIKRLGSMGTVSVDYATSDGTAYAGTDYEAVSGTLSWSDQDTSEKTITVPIIDNALQEPNKALQLFLSNPTGGASLGSSSSVVLTILDNEGMKISSSLIGHWQFNEGSGESMVDSSGNDNHATLINSPLWVEGVSGNALEFNGSNNYAEIEHNETLNVDNITMSAWIFRAADSSSNRIILNKENSYEIQVGKESGAGQDHFEFAIQPNWKWYDGGFVPLQEWTHVAVTWDGNQAVTYINGQTTSVHDLSDGVVTDTDKALRLGARGAPKPANSFFKGKMDDVRIYNRALSESEVASIANVVAPPPPPPPPPPDTAPAAVSDSATTKEDKPVTIDILDNDTGDTINAETVAIVTSPTNGAVVVNDSGAVTYTPTTGYFGTDVFSYTVQNNKGATSNEATVTITVIENQPPVITTEQDSYTVEIGEILNIVITATDNDSNNITIDANTADFPEAKLQ